MENQIYIPVQMPTIRKLVCLLMYCILYLVRQRCFVWGRALVSSYLLSYIRMCVGAKKKTSKHLLENAAEASAKRKMNIDNTQIPN